MMLTLASLKPLANANAPAVKKSRMTNLGIAGGTGYIWRQHANNSRAHRHKSFSHVNTCEKDLCL